MSKETPAYPIKPGFYWAKSDISYKWFNLIIEIYGTHPFLKWRVINLADSTITRSAESYADTPSRFVFGPKIKSPNA